MVRGCCGNAASCQFTSHASLIRGSDPLSPDAICASACGPSFAYRAQVHVQATTRLSSCEHFTSILTPELFNKGLRNTANFGETSQINQNQSKCQLHSTALLTLRSVHTIATQIHVSQSSPSSQNLFLGFAGLVTAATAWSIWGSDMFPAQADPKGEPEEWTEEEMKRWLNSVSWLHILVIVVDRLTYFRSVILWQARQRRGRNCWRE